MVTSTATPYDQPGKELRGWQRVRWSAVIAGLVLALVTQMLMTVLGLAIGLTAIDPATGVAVEAVGWSVAIWGILTILVSLFVGAYAAGYLSGAWPKVEGAINGLMVWALALLATAYLAGVGVGTVLSTTFGVAGTAVQAAAPAAGEEVATLDLERLEREVERMAPAARETAADLATMGAATAWALLIAALLGLAVAMWGGTVGARRSIHAAQRP